MEKHALMLEMTVEIAMLAKFPAVAKTVVVVVDLTVHQPQEVQFRLEFEPSLLLRTRR